MIKKILPMAIAAAFAAGSAQAASFLNGGFEDGTFSGWSQGAGRVTNPTASADGTALALNPADYAVGGSRYVASYQASAIVGVGLDPTLSALGVSLDTVKYGSYSARVNNWVNNYSVNTITQDVSNYDGSTINFAWSAVLDASHGKTDSDIFGLKITDTTTNTDLYSTVYSSASAPGAFTTGPSGWFYSGWQEVTLNVTQGHNFTMTLLAADCPYGGHAGYVYLDGFGTVAGGGGDNGTGGGGNTVPEPGSLALLGLGLAGLAASRRRKH